MPWNHALTILFLVQTKADIFIPFYIDNLSVNETPGYPMSALSSHCEQGRDQTRWVGGEQETELRVVHTETLDLPPVLSTMNRKENECNACMSLVSLPRSRTHTHTAYTFVSCVQHTRLHACLHVTTENK